MCITMAGFSLKQYWAEIMLAVYKVHETWTVLAYKKHYKKATLQYNK